MKKSYLSIAIAVVVVAVVVVMFGEKSEPENAQPAPQAMPVAVTSVKKEAIHLTHRLPGRVTPFRQAQIRPQVEGIITRRLFEEGAEVKKGDQLYQIDETRYRAVYKSALADLESAKSNVKAIEAKEIRYRDLVKIDAVSKQEYDNVVAELDKARAAIAVAQSSVDLAKVDLDYTKVYAPISGRISKSYITEGALVTANQSQYLAVITQLDPVYIDVQQSGTEHLYIRSRLELNHEIPVKLDLGVGAGFEYPYTGKMIFSEVTIDETSGSVAMRAEMPNPEGVLLPGLFVTAVSDLGEYELVLIPQRAATRMPDGRVQVWVVDETNHVNPRLVTAGHENGNRWIIDTGLSEGETIVVEGYQKLRPGMLVAPTRWQEDAPGSAPQGATQMGGAASGDSPESAGE